MLPGQPYSLSLELRMPPSEQNLRAGMFMLCLDILTAKGERISNAKGWFINSSCVIGTIQLVTQDCVGINTRKSNPLL